MNTKLATSRMRTGQWADIIKDCKESGLKVDDYCAQHGLSRNAYFYWLRKVKEAALTQSGFVEVRQQVEVSSCYPSPKLTASVNEIVLGINENTPMDLPANVANDYLTVTTNDIRQNSREISELNSKMNTLATKEDLKKVMDMLTKNILDDFRNDYPNFLKIAIFGIKSTK